MTEPTEPTKQLIPFPMNMTTREVLAFEEMTDVSVTSIFQNIAADRPSTKILIALMVISRRRNLPRTSWDEIVDAFGVTMDFDYESLKEAIAGFVAEQNDPALDDIAEAAGHSDIPKDESDTSVA